MSDAESMGGEEGVPQFELSREGMLSLLEQAEVQKRQLLELPGRLAAEPAQTEYVRGVYESWEKQKSVELDCLFWDLNTMAPRSDGKLWQEYISARVEASMQSVAAIPPGATDR
jgi:hypothetical protein